MTSRAGIAADTIGRRVQLVPYVHGDTVATVIGVTSRGLTVQTDYGATLKRITARDIVSWLD